jgi:hypothetical protein
LEAWFFTHPNISNFELPVYNHGYAYLKVTMPKKKSKYGPDKTVTSAGNRTFSNKSQNSISTGSKSIYRILSKIDSGFNAFGKKFSESHLIAFRSNSILFIGALLVLFIILVSSRIHYSNISEWDAFAKEQDSTGTDSKVLLGKPKFIRMDEWRVTTPFILSQIEKGFPVENYSLGAGKAPLMMSLPTHHFSALFHPENWGFFILDKERGFAYLWNYRIMALVISTFLLLMLLTRNKFWLSAFGAFFLLFSSFIQWWFSSSLSEFITAFNFIILSVIYIIYSRKPWVIILNMVVLLIFFLSFCLLLYPPFQVSLGLLMLALLAGYFLQNMDFETIKKYLPLKLLGFFILGLASSFLLYRYYLDVKDTVKITMDTAYPGHRISLGGNFGIERLFSGFFAIFFDEQKFIWMNICETSGFIFLFPIVVVALIVNLFRKQYNFLLLIVSAFLLGLAFYIVIGVPPIISKITLLSFVPSRRAIFSLGVGNIYLLILFLGSDQNTFRLKTLMNSILFIVLVFIFLASGNYLNSKSNEFFQSWQLGFISVFFALTAVFLINKKKLSFALMVLGYAILSTYSIQPVSRGLGFITGKKLYSDVKRILKTDPEGRWAVFNNPLESSFLVATGANTFSGTKYTPDIPAMRILDPARTYDTIYNRYANILVVSRPEVEGVDFKLMYEDYYGIAISPVSEKLKKLKITYFLIPDEPGSYNIDYGKNFGIKPVFNKPVDNFWILHNPPADSAIIQIPAETNNNSVSPLELRYFELARKCFFEKKTDSAVWYLGKVIAISPDNQAAYGNLAMILFQSNQKQKGLEILDKMKSRGMTVPGELIELSKK